MSISATVAKPNTPAGPNNCRAGQRFSCDVRVNCHLPSAWGGREIKWQARLTNVSSNGLNLVLRRRFEAGTGLSIDIPDVEGMSARTILARVAHVHREQGGMWQLGCSFVSELSEEELLALSQVAVDPDNKQPKVELTARGTYVYGVHFRGQLADGGVIGRYLKVLNVGKTWPVPPGRIFRLRFRARTGETPAVRVKVVACQSSADGWILHCAFLRAPSSAFLEARSDE
jgi:hypothetical protein